MKKYQKLLLTSQAVVAFALLCHQELAKAAQTTSSQETKTVQTQQTQVKANPLVESSQNEATLSYRAKIVNTGYSIDTKPWGEEGFKSAQVGSSDDYLGQTVQVTKESQNGYYARVQADKKELGWIDKRAFEGFAHPTYDANIEFSGYSVDTKPWGEEGFQTISFTNDHLGENVKVVLESKDQNYALAVKGGEELGWIDQRGLSDYVQPQKTTIVRSGYSVDTKPWGTPGFTLSSYGWSDGLLGKNVVVQRLDATQSYAFITDENNQNMGWIDRRAFAQNPTHGIGMVTRYGYSIDTKPWGEEGFTSAGKGSSADYVGERLEIVDESDNGAYVFVKSGDKGLGWLDKRALRFETIHQGTIRQAGYTLDSRPWGEEGFHDMKNGTSADYINQTVEIIDESDNGAYVFVKSGDKGLGWLDKRAFVADQAQKQQETPQTTEQTPDQPQTPSTPQVGSKEEHSASSQTPQEEENTTPSSESTQGSSSVEETPSSQENTPSSTEESATPDKGTPQSSGDDQNTNTTPSTEESATPDKDIPQPSGDDQNTNTTPSTEESATPDKVTPPTGDDHTSDTTPSKPEKPTVPNTDNQSTMSESEFIAAIQQEFHKLLNEHRVANGKQPIAYNSALQPYVDIRGKEIVEKFSHTRPNGKDPFSVIPENMYTSRKTETGGTMGGSAGENITETTMLIGDKFSSRAAIDTAAELFNQWKNSPGHNYNMLDDSNVSHALGIGLKGDGHYKVSTVYAADLFLKQH
ncbi:GW dipeptide domain-containing protein [Aerococcus christensenii]|uniref:GW dipeptide domain-containing protein n=1 Tax=Aerococcus christensenii TaxID=87541 RepID=UPI00254FB3EF|nr:GW dipeptide domain-containing protein [Aerococcus christensenii]MDK8234627.1 GW dipeptide domain-containing protein [Aerococcus christensenii]